MAINASGTISIGGSTAGQSINLELGRAATATSNLNETELRNLAGVASGSISLSNFYGKSVRGQVEFTTPGTTSWTVPAGVSSISILCIGGGGGGGYGYEGVEEPDDGGGGGGAGGGLSYTTSTTVTPGENLTIIVGNAGVGATSYVDGGVGGNTAVQRSGTNLCLAIRGSGGFRGAIFYGGPGGTCVNTTSGVGTGRYNGGDGGRGDTDDVGGASGGGGGGSSGYAGNGGQGYNWYTFTATGGSGGGGAGGDNPQHYSGGGGGGVGILGQGTSGSVITNSGGGGGSGGTNGGTVTSTSSFGGTGGVYGAGGGGGNSLVKNGGNGSAGAIRIIWGSGRSYPSTNTGNV